MTSPHLGSDEIAAVVLNYHRPQLTLQCIQSLLEADATKIVVWDNSTDNGESMAMISQAISSIENAGHRITIIGKNINLGFSAGVNAAIAALDQQDAARFVLLINNDATINAVGLSSLYRALTSDSMNAIAAPKQLNSTNHFPSLLFYQPHLAALTKEKYCDSLPFLSGCCLLLDLAKTGRKPLDEQFFMYGEDIALSLRLQREGYRLAISDTAEVEHIGAASSKPGSAFYEYHVIRGHLLLTRMLTDSTIKMIVLWPCRLLSLSARSIWRALKSQTLTPVIAFWRALFALRPSA